MSFSGPSGVRIKQFNFYLPADSVVIAPGGTALIVSIPAGVYPLPANLDPAQPSIVIYGLQGSMEIDGLTTPGLANLYIEIGDNTNTAHSIAQLGALRLLLPVGGTFGKLVNSETQLGNSIVQRATSFFPLQIQFVITDGGAGGTYSWSQVKAFLLVVGP